MRPGIERILFICIIIFFFAACGNDSSRDIAFERGEAPDEVFEDFVTQESDSGRVRWKLTAPLANRFKASQSVLMDEPKIEFFNSKGELETTLTSEKGEYNEQTRDMLAYGNVVVVSVEGDVLETDSLLWVNARDKIISNCFVKLTRGKDVITGIGMECDQDLSSVVIKKNVQAEIIDEKGDNDE